MQAIGLFELQGYVPALAATDIMLKTANVKFLTWEKKLGGWLVTIVIQGEVSAVTAAIRQPRRAPYESTLPLRLSLIRTRRL